MPLFLLFSLASYLYLENTTAGMMTKLGARDRWEGRAFIMFIFKEKREIVDAILSLMKPVRMLVLTPKAQEIQFLYKYF